MTRPNSDFSLMSDLFFSCRYTKFATALRTTVALPHPRFMNSTLVQNCQIAHQLSALTAFLNERDALGACKADLSLTACWTKGRRLATVTSTSFIVNTRCHCSQTIETQETSSFRNSLDHVRLSYLELFVALYECGPSKAAAHYE